MADWDAVLYSRFERERTRPARDLLAQVEPLRAQVIVDLGCGPGNSTELLRRRFPDSEITGIDNSEAMLTAASARLPDVTFIRADIQTWAVDCEPDLLFANASLHWVADHAALLPRLFASLTPGGVLAFQVPDNSDEPSHRLMRTVAGRSPWLEAFGSPPAAGRAVLSAAEYYDLLAPRAASVEVWRTIYHHPLAGPEAIVDWLTSTGLKPYLDPLPADLRAGFLEEYRREIDTAYPPRSDGRRLLTFPRLFVTAEKSG